MQLTGPPMTNERSALNPTSISDVRKSVLKAILVPSNRILEPRPCLINLGLLLNAHVAHTFTFKF